MRAHFAFGITGLMVAAAAAGVGCGVEPTVTQDRFPVLTQVDLIPDGTECRSGGVHVRAGLDENGDTRLQPGEVQTDKVSCNLDSVEFSALTPGHPRLRTSETTLPEFLTGDERACSGNHTPISQSTAIPAGATCANGGVATQLACDANANGLADASEVVWSFNTCFPPSAATLVNLVQLAVGNANCSNGGVAIQSGIDDNKDGTLQSTEVDSTAFVCNGANGSNGQNGATSLVKVGTEPVGTNCLNGGTRIDSGVDTSRNGILEAGEITSTTFMCNVTAPPIDCSAFAAGAIATGTFVVQSAAGITALAGKQCIDGSLLVAGLNQNSLAGLEGLQRVTGDVFLLGNATLTTLNGLSGLSRVGRELNVSNNAALQTIGGLTSLAGVGQRLAVSNNRAITSIGALPGLLEANRIEVIGDPALTSLGFTSLRHASGSIFIIDDDALDTSNLFPALKQLDGTLGVTDNLGATSLGLPLLERCGATLDVERNAGLQSINAPALTFIGFGLTLASDDALATVSLPNLASISADAGISALPALTTLTLPRLAVVGRSLGLDSLPALTGVGLTSLVAVGSSLSLNRTGLTGLGGFAALSSTGANLVITNNAALATATATSFAGTVSVGGTTTITGNAP